MPTLSDLLRLPQGQMPEGWGRLGDLADAGSLNPLMKPKFDPNNPALQSVMGVWGNHPSPSPTPTQVYNAPPGYLQGPAPMAAEPQFGRFNNPGLQQSYDRMMQQAQEQQDRLAADPNPSPSPATKKRKGGAKVPAPEVYPATE